MHHQPVTQPLRDKLRDAGFAPPEPAQKPRNLRHKSSGRETAKPCKEPQMNEQTPAQANPETTTPNTTGIPQIPNVPDPVMQEVSKVTDALAKRIAGEPAKQVDWAGVAQFGMKTAIIVGGVAAATAAVVLITRAGSDGPIELPATPSV